MYLNAFLIAITFTFCGSPGNTSNDYYSTEDFERVKKIDTHVHINTNESDILEQARIDNFILISLNTEVPDYPTIEDQQNYILNQRKKYGAGINWLTTFETKTINQSGWSNRQLEYLKTSFKKGALGIKVWKNIGMAIKDKDSNFIMIDNPIFDPIFNYLEANKIPVCGHLGEPKNCWLPIEKMTTNNDRSYFASHPEYHMYLHPDYPSYDAQIVARDRLLEKHPNLTFIGAHLGSLEWNVDEIAKRLEKFPNMLIEPAERLGQIQYQSLTNWQKVHDFFIKYQDRILYGTDTEPDSTQNSVQIRKKAHDNWLIDWKYFNSGDSLVSERLNQKFKGLKLPKSVVDKIYYLNAHKCYFNKRENLN